MKKIASIAVIAMVILLIGGESVARKKKRPESKLVDYTVVTGFADTLDSPRGYVDLYEASASVVAAKKGTLIVRFSSESLCYGTQKGYCSVRVLVDGLEADPIDESGTHYDSTGGGGSQSRSIERSMRDVTKGKHDVVVQWGTFGGSDTRFALGAWHLTVESLR